LYFLSIPPQPVYHSAPVSVKTDIDIQRNIKKHVTSFETLLAS